MNVEDPKALRSAARRLSLLCPVIAKAVDVSGVPPWRCDEPGYRGLARTIVYQQLSTRAAATIWSRVQSRFGDLEPDIIMGADAEILRACGLSRGKVEHLKAIAQAIVTGALDFERISGASDEEARKELMSIRGVGPWTADIYLMFSLRRPDVFPHGDLGLAEAYRILANTEDRPGPKDLLAIAERWRPLRAVAAHLLWSSLNAMRS